MKKSYLLGALGLLAMASCSQDETIGVNHDGDEITFSVVTNSATRAADVYCNNNLPGGFHVSAISDGQSYINGDDIKKQDGKWVNTDGTRYWPEDAVDFYAHVNGGTTYQWSVSAGKASAKFENFTVAGQVANQVDLLYAVKTGQKKPATETPVTLNFRHALSQILFQARNDSKNLYVEIAGVKVVNVGNTNTFTFPSANTEKHYGGDVDGDHSGYGPTDGVYDPDGDETYEDSEDDPANITYDGSWGTWNTLSGGNTTYEIDLSSNAIVKGDGNLVSLTTKNDENKEYSSLALLLLPQTTTAWVPSTTSPVPTENNIGSYFLVDCKIYNVAGEEYNSESDVCLWGKPQDGGYTTKELAIPVAFTWEQGKKYVYTLVFGNGNGGYDPDPEEPDPEDPKPVLVPISYQITVDDFDPISGGDIETGVPGE